VVLCVVVSVQQHCGTEVHCAHHRVVHSHPLEGVFTIPKSVFHLPAHACPCGIPMVLHFVGVMASSTVIVHVLHRHRLFQTCAGAKPACGARKVCKTIAFFLRAVLKIQHGVGAAATVLFVVCF